MGFGIGLFDDWYCGFLEIEGVDMLEVGIGGVLNVFWLFEDV